MPRVKYTRFAVFCLYTVCLFFVLREKSGQICGHERHNTTTDAEAGDDGDDTDENFNYDSYAGDGSSTDVKLLSNKRMNSTYFYNSALFHLKGLEQLLVDYRRWADKLEYKPGRMLPRTALVSVGPGSTPGELNQVFPGFAAETEISAAQKGSPLSPLKKYKNPCWWAGVPQAADLENIYNASSVFRKRSRYHATKCLNSARGDLTQLYMAGATHRIRCLPYFYILGVTKSGTTDLFILLNKHPTIVTPCTKEPMFWNFAPTTINSTKEVSFADYINIFDGTGTALLRQELTRGINSQKYITGDASPNYLWEYKYWWLLEQNKGLPEPKVTIAHALYSMQPQARFIVILRNPSDRVYSQAAMFKKGSGGQFHQGVIRGAKIFLTCLKNTTVRECAYALQTRPGIVRYMAASLYYVYISEWLELFPIEQFHFIKAEEYFKSRSKVIPGVLDFLKIEDSNEAFINEANSQTPQNTKKTSKTSESMRPQTRQILDAIYKPFNTKLAELLGDNKWLWRRRVGE